MGWISTKDALHVNAVRQSPDRVRLQILAPHYHIWRSGGSPAESSIPSRRGTPLAHDESPEAGFAKEIEPMRWNIRKRFRRLMRREGSDLAIALLTGIVTNMITDAMDRRRARTADERSQAKHA
jgi:hypothetical protein